MNLMVFFRHFLVVSVVGILVCLVLFVFHSEILQTHSQGSKYSSFLRPSIGPSSLASRPEQQDKKYFSISATDGFNERQREYLEYCSTTASGFSPNVCRAYLGVNTYNSTIFQEKIKKINERHDTSDFDLNTILRILVFDRRRPSLPQKLRDEMKQSVLNFKYWLDEPGPDDMIFWSENHQILFAAAEMVAGQLWPDETFSNSGVTGRAHMSKAIHRIEQWLEFRFRFGFSEWHSNQYFDEDMAALLNIVDFAEDEGIATRAAMVMDILVFDMASNYYKGAFATTHGRTYPINLLNGLTDATTHSIWIMLGLGGDRVLLNSSAHSFSSCYLATSDRYKIPPVLEQIAIHSSKNIIHRQRDGINIADGPEYGIGYQSPEDLTFWWGMTAYFSPRVIQGSYYMAEGLNVYKDLYWEHQIIKMLGQYFPSLRTISKVFGQLSNGAALESVSTYTYRTPHYQLSGAQDYKAGVWTAQVHIWKATLDSDAYVFTSYPGGFDTDYMAGNWTGGFIPRVTMHENVGIIQYKRPHIPILDHFFFPEYSHAYFPRNSFDEVVQFGHWVAGRKASSYLALWSSTKPFWSEVVEDQLIANSRENVWIVELGDYDSNGPFDEFVKGIHEANVAIDEGNNNQVEYDSPSQGTVSVGWEGSFIVDGKPIDIGPYERWDNIYAKQTFNTKHLVMMLDGNHLELDFSNYKRRVHNNVSSNFP